MDCRILHACAKDETEPLVCFIAIYGSLRRLWPQSETRHVVSRILVHILAILYVFVMLDLKPGGVRSSGLTAQCNKKPTDGQLPRALVTSCYWTKGTSV